MPTSQVCEDWYRVTGFCQRLEGWGQGGMWATFLDLVTVFMPPYASWFAFTELANSLGHVSVRCVWSLSWRAVGSINLCPPGVGPSRNPNALSPRMCATERPWVCREGSVWCGPQSGCPSGVLWIHFPVCIAEVTAIAATSTMSITQGRPGHLGLWMCMVCSVEKWYKRAAHTSLQGHPIRREHEDMVCELSPQKSVRGNYL